MKNSLRICNINAAPGTKAATFVDVLHRVSGQKVGFPLQVVNGLHDGPTLLILAGSHACEYAGIEATIRVFKETDPTTLHGAVICVPVLNTTAFETRTPYVCPIDGLNISGQFPGNAGGSPSQRIANCFFNDVVLKSNYVIDMHGGDLPEELSPYAIFSCSGISRVDSESENMAKLYPVEIVDEVSRPGMLVHESALRGIPGIVGEAGGLGRLLEQDVMVHIEGARNIMGHFGMINFQSRYRENVRKTKGEKIRLAVSESGILRLHVKVGEKVEKGGLLAEIFDLQGDKLEELRSPETALVRILIPHYVVNEGDKVIFLSKLES